MRILGIHRLRLVALLAWGLIAVPVPLAQAVEFVDDVVLAPEGKVFTPPPLPPPSLTDRCVVSVLNRTARVQSDGTVALPNVPSNFGPVRARATCTVKGTTFTGQSELLTVPPGGGADIGAIRFDAPVPVPASLAIAAATPTLPASGATSQLTVTATFPDGSSADVTADAGTVYRSSSPGTATVSPAGLVTAVDGGPVLVTVQHEGTTGFIRLNVDGVTPDSDGDGIPDAVELANGLDPADALDGFADPDGDGLTNKQELVDFGTNPHVGDSDGDGLSDQVEVTTHHTNPLSADTDGDGLRDGLEIQTGSNPLDATSFDLAAALTAVDVTPAQFLLTLNTLLGEASLPLVVTGHLTDGSTLDLTPVAKGTTYASSDLAVCNFGGDAGRVFAGSPGRCTITVAIANTPFSVDVPGRVQTFAPTALSFLTIPGFANNVDVSGDVAYVAAGSAGLQVVDVSDRRHPHIIGALDTAGNANDVRVVGTTAYVADGAAGLVIIDVTDPTQPMLLGSVDTPGVAQDLVVKGTLAYVADGAAGLQVIDVTDPTMPMLLGTADTPGTAKGVDVRADQPIAVVADGSMARVVDVTDPAHPAVVGSVNTFSDDRDVVVLGSVALVANSPNGLFGIDVGDPVHPVTRTTIPPAQGGRLVDVAAVGRFAAGADIGFANLVPIFDVGTPATPVLKAYVDFTGFRADDGIGIAMDPSFVYLTAGSLTENGVTLNTTRLYIGQYLTPVDTAGSPPSVEITAPAAATTVIEDDVVPIAVTAGDDVAVASVDLFVDGTRIQTLTVPPYQHTLTAPTGVSSFTLGATAIDFGSNLGTAADVVVNVIPDPNTTVTGRTIDEAGAPLPGATVTCLGVSGTSGADGRFAIAGVPTIRGNVACSATVPDALARALTGSVTGGAPVRGGTTAVPDFVLTVRVAFAPGQRNNTGAFPVRLRSADVNRDGVLDLLTTHIAGANTIANADAVALLLGNGNGTFQLRRIIQPFPGVGVTDVAVGDLDHDQNPDLVVSQGSTVSVLRGKGDGTFFPPQSFATGIGGGGVAIGDLDGDGDLDVVRSNRSAATVSVLLGNGDGTLAEAQTFATPALPGTVVLADLDGHGALDVVVATSTVVAILLGNGDGTLQAYVAAGSGTGPADVTVADMNGDGKLDIVTSNISRNDVSVFLGNGDGTMGAERRFPVPSSLGVAVGDINGDGIQDVATAGFNTQQVHIVLGDGDGTLRKEQHFPGPAGDVLRDVVVGDMNGDTFPDIAVAGTNGSVVWVMLQQR